ncbi:MAG: hypothetical protein M3303_05035 [Gemmatimonadota bacterium]|nr:hypothetical protein [Gemmatimonadota bacterium]
MLRHSFLTAVTAVALLAPPAAAQQPTQQGRRDSVAVADPAASAALFLQAQADGRMAAARAGTAGWAIGGFASGFFVGLIGTGVSWALAGSSHVELPADQRLLIVSQPVTYQQAYEKGYADRVRSKRKSSALTNGLLGTALFLTIFVSATSGY